MATVARIDVAVGSDISGFQTGMQSVDARLKTMQNNLNKFGNTMMKNFTLPIVAGLGLAVKGAAELEGAMAKFDVVFAGMTDEMYSWVDSFRSEFPLARREIIKFAAGLQDLMVPMGINRDLAADMVQEFMYVAGALAAFNDVPIGDVLNAISSGLAGMSRPLREYGADITETALKHHALAEGIWDGVEAWDAEIRAVALLSKLYADSADAVDGLEEQKGSLLWMIEELKASFKDFGDEIGTVLLPAIKNVVDGILEWLGGLKDLDEKQLETIVKIALFVAAIGPASKLMAALIGIHRFVMGIASGLGLLAGAKGFAAAGTAAQGAVGGVMALKVAMGLLYVKIGLVVAAIYLAIEAWKALKRLEESGPIMPGYDSSQGLGAQSGVSDAISGMKWGWEEQSKIEQHHPGYWHTGGVFRAPRLGGEGYALLKDGETVTPAGVDAGQGGTSHITMNITQNITDQKTADYATNKLIEGLQKRGSNRGLF